MMKPLFILFILISICMSSFTELPESIPSSTDQIEIIAWSGPPATATSYDYKILAEAGFTMSISKYPNAASAERALKFAQAHGIKLLLHCPELRSEPEKTVNRLKTFSALEGYYLTDEPNALKLDYWSRLAKRIRKADPDRMVYVNLYPNRASRVLLGKLNYSSYLESYLKKFDPEILSFDHYPIRKDRFSESYYENLEQVAQAARNKGIPFWTCILSTAHGYYPVPTKTHLRFQVYSSLAYGAQGIQYFTYWIIPAKGNDFHDAPVDWKGQTTKVYDLVKQMNREIKDLSPIFLGAQLVSVEHTGEDIPQGTRRFQPGSPVYVLKTKGKGAVVSLLEKGEDRFLVIVNRDYENPMLLTLVFDDSRLISRIDKKSRSLPLREFIHNCQLEPGDVEIFSWKTGKK